MPLPDLTQFSRQDERLRDVATDLSRVRTALDEAELQLAVEETDALHTYAGHAARLLGWHDAAIAHLMRALELHPTPQARIRLGEAYRCADRTDEAIAELTAALAEVRGAPHEDFALQHLGKAFLDAGRKEEAREALTSALDLRRTKGDAALIESTERALALLRET